MFHRLFSVLALSGTLFSISLNLNYILQRCIDMCSYILQYLAYFWIAMDVPTKKVSIDVKIVILLRLGNAIPSKTMNNT